jgi:hypothetical protein
MKKQLVVIALSFVAAAAMAAGNPESGNKLQPFSGADDGYTGTATLAGDGCAIIDTVDGDNDPYNNYAGVYIYPTLPPKPIGDVNKLSFDFVGGPVVGGSPRLSVPIDENGDGTVEAYAFIDAALSGLTTEGTVDLTSPVAYGATVYENWQAFATANPAYRIGKAITFIIADQPFQGVICNVQIGKSAAK